MKAMKAVFLTRGTLTAALSSLTAMAILFTACGNAAGGDPGEADPIAQSIRLPDSLWSDALNPATTLDFSATQVTLGGGKAAGAAENWYWGALDGRSCTFSMVNDPTVMENIIQRTEANWGYDTPLPEAMVIVWTDPQNQVGFQLYYYGADPGTKDYDRLVCFGVGQPHEFRRQ